MNGQFVATVSVALAFLGLGCAGSSDNPPPRVATQWSQSGAVVVGRQGSTEAAPYAPSGTAFEVRLDQTVDTRTSAPGDPVSATLVGPITASNGAVLVPAGSEVRGHLGAIDRSSGAPRLEMAFDAIEIGGTTAPIGVRLLSAEQSEYETLPGSTGVSNMQAQSETSPRPVEQISMNKGARLRLALTRPIVASGGGK